MWLYGCVAVWLCGGVTVLLWLYGVAVAVWWCKSVAVFGCLAVWLYCRYMTITMTKANLTTMLLLLPISLMTVPVSS